MVDYLTYEGKEWPVLFGHIAFNEYEKLTGEPFADIGEDIEKHARLLWIGIKTGHRKLKEDFYVDEKPVITMEDCLWMLDDIWVDYFNLVVSSMAKKANMSVEELIELGQKIKDEKKEPAKKKAPAKTPKKTNG